MCAVAVVVPADTSSADDVSYYGLEPKDNDYAKVSSSLTYTLSYHIPSGSSATYKATLEDSDGNSVGSISSSYASGTLTSGNNSKSIYFTLPSTAGEYYLKVVVTEGDKTTERIATTYAVDPITLSVTLENKGDVARNFKAYFYIQDGDNWNKIDGSSKDVNISANGTQTVTYDYIVKDVSKTTFCLQAEDPTIGGEIVGLGPDNAHTYYTDENDYRLIEYICIAVLIVLAIVAIYIYRKPVKNRGKPKARR